MNDAAQMGLRRVCCLLNALYSFRMTPQPAPPFSHSPALPDVIIFPTSILYFCSPSPRSSPWHPQEQGNPRDLQLPLGTPALTWGHAGRW